VKAKRLEASEDRPLPLYLVECDENDAPLLRLKTAAAFFTGTRLEK
jgi:hypothetical protein